MAAEGRNLLEVVLNTDIAKKFNEVDNSVSKLQSTLEKATSSANKFAEALKKVANSFKDSGSLDIAQKIASIVDSMNKLNTITEKSSGLSSISQGINTVGSTATQNISNVDSFVKSLNRLYNEQLIYENKIAQLEKLQAVKNTQGAYSPEINDAIQRYKSLLESVVKETETLSNKNKQAADEARKLYDAKHAEQSIINEERKQKAIDQTVKAVERLNKAQERQRNEERNSRIGLAGGEAPRTIREYEIAISNLRREIKNLDVETQSGQINEYNKRITEYKKKVDEATGATNRFRQENIKLNNVLQQVAGAFGVYIGLQAFTNLARRVRETTGEFELQHRALQAIIQDTQAANQIWEKTIKLAVRSPYNVKQLVTYTKQLAAYRVESDKLYDTTKMLADISSGLGVDMQRLILAYGQVKAANYLRGQELRQFSEAGINILGELAKYFTELKGQAVSTGQVFEMVSKRMVKFEDVAEVLHRLTEEGGAFYKMQEIQAETLSGIYANLKDRVDLALNSMGQDTRGVLVGLAKAATFLLENWRAFSNMLTSGMIIWGFYKLEVLRAAMAKGAFTAATIQATAAEGGFIGMLAKSKLALKAFATSIKTIFTTGLGIAGVVIAALVAIGKAIYDHNKKIEEARKKYDELNQGINKNGISGFNRLSDAIQENNNKIRENIRLRDKAKESGEKEKEVQLQAEINQLQEKNNKLVDDIRDKYSELSDEIQTTAEGIVELGAGAKELAHIQTMTTDLINIFGENAGRKSDITETTKELELAFNELEMATSQFNTQFNYWINNVERELEKSTVFSESFKESIHSIVDNRTLSSFEKYNLILEKLNNNYYQYSGAFGSIGNEYVKGIEKAQNKVDKLERNIAEEVERTSEKVKEMWDVVGDKESAQKASEGFIKNLGFLKGAVSDFLARMFSEKLDINVQVNVDDSKKQLLKWQEDVNKFIEDTIGTKKQGTTIPISLKIDDSQEGKDDYKKKVKKELDDVKEIIRSYEDTKKRGIKNLLYSIDDYNNALSELPDIQALYDSLGGDDKNKGGKSNPALELLNKQIEAIKNATKQYDEYKKLYEDTSAFNKTKEAVKGLFDELNIGNLLDKSDVFNEEAQLGEEGLKKWLDASIAAAGKAGNQAAEKYLRELQLRLDKEDFKNVVDDFKNNMEEAFADYDMYKELEKLGIGGDISESVFGVTTKSLNQLKAELEKRKKLLLQQYGGDDAVKAVEDMEKKITEMENKETVERLKKYTNYLIKGRDEAVKIHLDQLTKMGELDDLYAKGHYTKTQYDSIAKEIQKEAQEALAKNDWKTFKESDFYTTMFEDLANVSGSSLKLMIDKLNQLKYKMKDLDPTQVKEIVQSLEKLEEEGRKRSPLKSFIDDIRKMRGWDKKKNEETMNFLVPKQSQLQKEKERVAKIVAELQAEYNKLSKDEIPDNEDETKKRLDIYELQLKLINDQLEEVDKNIGEITKEDNIGQAAFNRVFEGIEKASGYFNQIVDAVGSISEDMIDIFGGAEDSAKQLSKDIAEMATNFGLLVADIAKAISSEGTDVGAMIDGLVRTWNIIKNGLSMNEWDINQTIESNTKKLEEIEFQYDRVQRASERAWNTHDIVEYHKQMNLMIQSQIKAYEAMIKAEEARKSPDDAKINEWKRKTQEAYEAMEDEAEEFYERVGGIGAGNYGDEAQNFVDAWFEAFKETGDGLSGLQEHFNEIIENMVKRQAMQRLAENLMGGLFGMIDRNARDGMITRPELDEINNFAEEQLPMWNEALKNFAQSLGILGNQAEGELDGLQRGIQGVTEQTAEIIAAYMNAIRYYVIDNNTKLGQIISSLQDSTGTFNPMIAELQNIRQQAEDIRNLLFSWRETSGVPSMRVTIV